jgi:hypothetical protein
MKNHCRSLEPPGKFILALALAFTLYPTQARADIVSVCANTAVTEGSTALDGYSGEVTCTVTNNGIGTGADLVAIEDVFAFAYPVAGDRSDDITAVDVIGPDPVIGNPVTFEVLFDTDAADTDDPHPDFGINDVSLILYAEDTVTGDFVPGTYTSAAVGVYDTGVPPEVPKTVRPPISITSPDDYFDTVDCVADRDIVNSDIPEPTPFLLLGTGLFGLIGIARKRSAI